jgi:hypothetical protein
MADVVVAVNGSNETNKPIVEAEGLKALAKVVWRLGGLEG